MTVGLVLDVSSANHPGGAPIDYQAVADDPQGITAVNIKATQGTTYTNPYFAQDLTGFRAVGLAVSAYHYAMFTTPLAEAAYFIKVAGLFAQIGDFETSTDRAWMDRFLACLRPEKMSYGSASSLPAGLPGVEWLADYARNPGRGICWQYTSLGQVNGITGHVDLSRWTGTAAAYQQFYGVVGPAPPPPKGVENVGVAVKPTGETVIEGLRSDGHLIAFTQTPHAPNGWAVVDLTDAGSASGAAPPGTSWTFTQA